MATVFYRVRKSPTFGSLTVCFALKFLRVVIACCMPSVFMLVSTWEHSTPVGGNDTVAPGLGVVLQACMDPEVVRHS